jgi:hypothetical protein
MAPKDLYNIEGLCGNFDNNQTNDFRHRDGAISENNQANRNNHFADFTESWRYYDDNTIYFLNQFHIIALLPFYTKRLYCTIISVFLVLCTNDIFVCAYSFIYVHSLFYFAHTVLCYEHLVTDLAFD